MVILGLGFLILFLVSLVRRRVLILRIGSRRLLLRMNDVVMVFLLGGLVRGLFLLLILVWIWLLLRKKLNQTEQSLPSTERRCATQTRSREQLCLLHLSILKSLTVIRDSFNVIFPLFVYLWGLQRRAIRTWQAHVAHHALIFVRNVKAKVASVYAQCFSSRDRKT